MSATETQEAPAPKQMTELQVLNKRAGDLLERQLPEIAKALPKFMAQHADTFVRIALTTIKRNPLLLQADQSSLAGSLMDAAQCGLIVDGILGQGHLVPFKEKGVYKVQFIPGYKGLIKLAYQSDSVALIEPRMVYGGDLFQFAYGLNPDLSHVPTDADNRGALTHTYMIVRMKGNQSFFHVMDVAQVNEVREQSASWKFKKQYSPWTTHYDAMALKTVIRHGLKYVPQSAANLPLQRAIGLDEAAEANARTPEYSVKDGPTIETTDAFFDEPEPACNYKTGDAEPKTKEEPEESPETDTSAHREDTEQDDDNPFAGFNEQHGGR